MEFVALDFETASLRRGSACEIGLIHFRNGREIDRFSTLIKPHESERFSPRAISIHGITPEMVSNAPSFDEIANDIFAFIGNKPVVAHNASFDASVMAQSALVNKVKVPTIDFYCSLSMSRRYPEKLTSYSLPIVADYFGIDFEETHRADADAEAVGCILNAINKFYEMSSLEDLASHLGVGKTQPSLIQGGNGSSGFGDGKIVELRKAAAIAYSNSLAEADLIKNELVAGKEFIFTGKLRSMEKTEAQQEVLKRLGLTKGNVAKSTDYLVLGSEFIEELKSGGQLSEKLNKSIRYQNQGVDIAFIDEKQFLEMLSADQ